MLLTSTSDGVRTEGGVIEMRDSGTVATGDVDSGGTSGRVGPRGLSSTSGGNPGLSVSVTSHDVRGDAIRVAGGANKMRRRGNGEFGTAFLDKNVDSSEKNVAFSRATERIGRERSKRHDIQEF